MVWQSRGDRLETINFPGVSCYVLHVEEGKQLLCPCLLPEQENIKDEEKTLELSEKRVFFPVPKARVLDF